MKEFCENQYCDAPGAKEVDVSVHKPGDQKRTFRDPCAEAYVIGCQHGRMQSQAAEIWLVAIADRGLVFFVKAYANETLALKGVATYLRQQHGYQGPLIREAVNDWLDQHDEPLSIEVECQRGIRGDPQPAHMRTLTRSDRYLQKHRFILLVKNGHDPSPFGPYEAWAYEGPLDFSEAVANCFGVGDSIRDCIDALNVQLDHWRKGQSEEITKRLPGGPQ